MGNEKEGDVRVPLVFAVFFLSVIAGGVFLIIYVFCPGISQPWYPAAALFLIGAPWMFWLLTYFYTIMKRCCAPRRHSSAGEQPEMPLTTSV